jgi:RNA polymerase sigma factor (sigma-70 family)
MDSSREFWERMYRDNAPKFKGLCRRYVANPELAEDLVHDAFLKAIDKQSTYQGKGNFEGWLRQIVVNTALMYLRSHKNYKENCLVEINEWSDYSEINDNESVYSIIEDADFTNKDLLEAIDSLPLHHKLVFNLYVMEDYSHKQIAQKLNISEGTSKSHLARARKRVRDLLYQKASSRKTEKALTAALLPGLLKAHPIDSLYRSRMRNFSIGTVKDADLFLSKVDWTKQLRPLVAQKKARHLSFQIAKYSLIPAVFTAVLMQSVHAPSAYQNQPSIEMHELPEKEPAPGSIADTLMVTVDKLETKPDTTTKTETIPKAVEKKPVVVKKTIVQKQVVKIHKTVKISDTVTTEEYDTTASLVCDTLASRIYENKDSE